MVSSKLLTNSGDAGFILGAAAVFLLFLTAKLTLPAPRRPKGIRGPKSSLTARTPNSWLIAWRKNEIRN